MALNSVSQPTLLSKTGLNRFKPIVIRQTDNTEIYNLRDDSKVLVRAYFKYEHALLFLASRCIKLIAG